MPSTRSSSTSSPRTVRANTLVEADPARARCKTGTINVTFSWRPGSATAPVKTTKLKSFVSKQSNAVWAVQPFWPVRAEYLIAHVADDYSTTIIARSARDYVWIMARTPSIAAAVKDDLLAKTKALGYDTAKLRDVPQAPR